MLPCTYPPRYQPETVNILITIIGIDFLSLLLLLLLLLLIIIAFSLPKIAEKLQRPAVEAAIVPAVIAQRS